jgi:septal ring factor EnvC (AmiA/AmiB activator)
MKISATKDGDSQINKSSSGLFLGIVFVLLLTGILGLSLWVSELSKASNSINSKVESRLLILEEQLQLADSTSTESLSDINSQLQFLDKEIRKLWDLSNKRNKVKIAELNEDIEKQTNALKELAATQTNDQKNINAIQQESQKLSILVDELSRSNKENLNTQNKIAELSRSILLLEETVQAFDAYRKQNNELLQEMQLQMSNFRVEENIAN